MYSNLETTIKEGIEQTKSYMDKCGTTDGHLIIFDRRANKPWEEKIWDKKIEGIHVWGS